MTRQHRALQEGLQDATIVLKVVKVACYTMASVPNSLQYLWGTHHFEVSFGIQGKRNSTNWAGVTKVQLGIK